MKNWQRRQLTFGTQKREYHAHSYYDIPAFDASSRFLAVHRMDFADRAPEADERVAVGIMDCDRPSDLEIVGLTPAWSWQQGPMAQWQPGTRRLFWNDREDIPRS